MFEWLVTDPNLVYLLLVFGLWAAVTAAYIPGTGLIELVAIGALVAEFYILSTLPTNWLAVLLLVIGVLGFLLIPFVNQRWVRLAEAGLILQAVGGILLFNGGLHVSWLLIAVTVGAALVYHRFALMPLLERAWHQAAVLDDSGQLVGAIGRASKSFDLVGKLYVGTVHVNGEHWTATSTRPLEMGDSIVVVEREGLQLVVENVKHKHTPENHFEEV